MVTLNLAIGIELVFTCDQCQAVMQLEGPSVKRPATSLKCPKCGFRVTVNQGAGAQIPGARGPKFPAFQPKTF
jgi:Zn finger protein HypA/HybF involved in hydrogenase expression